MTNLVTQLIKVRDVRDDTYHLDSSSLRAVLAVPGINFSLLAEREKETVIAQFKEFLDGLDDKIEVFRFQVLVHADVQPVVPEIFGLRKIAELVA